MKLSVAIVIRTLNEEKYLGKVLSAIKKQNLNEIQIKIIIVDSGSTDNTLTIAQQYNANIIEIPKERFTYGYALNTGLQQALDDDIAVCLSCHCIPRGKSWLKKLISPIIEEKADMSFGSHLGASFARTSERNYFKYKFSHLKKGLASPLYFNNGNSAFKITTWKKHQFDEFVKGQEDVEMATRAVQKGSKVYFVPTALVTHIHNDKNIVLLKRILNIFESDIKIKAKKPLDMFPEAWKSIQMIQLDIKVAAKKKILKKALPGILKFRIIVVIAALLSIIRSPFKSNFHE